MYERTAVEHERVVETVERWYADGWPFTIDAVRHRGHTAYGRTATVLREMAEAGVLERLPDGPRRLAIYRVRT